MPTTQVQDVTFLSRGKEIRVGLYTICNSPGPQVSDIVVVNLLLRAGCSKVCAFVIEHGYYPWSDELRLRRIRGVSRQFHELSVTPEAKIRERMQE